MRRLLAVLVALGLTVAPSRAPAQQIPVGPGSDLSSLVGLPIDVPFVVDLSARSERLGSFALRIQWDTTRLRLAWSASTSFGSAQVNPDSLPFGIARIAGVNPAGAAGRVTVATVRITPLVRDTATLRLSLTELYAAGTFADLLPSAVVTNGAYCPARGRWGDIDGDGNANSRDALIALSNAVGLDVSAFDVSLGDVDGSGTTNARDALIILSNAVGVDVSAFRVLRLAAGACAANALRALTIVPGTPELVTGQTVLFEARAGDGAGGLQAITDVTWTSDRPAILGVLADGSGVARDTGTAVVTVRRGTSDSAQTAVHIVARRRVHWVDALAAGATNRLGTVALPFGSLNEGVHFAQAGDTVRVRVGAYDLSRDGNGQLTVSVPMVVIGDTAADGSRPAITAVAGDNAVLLDGPGSVEIQNFDVAGFSNAFVVAGPSRALFRGVRVEHVGTGVLVSTHAGVVRVERSRLVGPGPQGEGYSGTGVELGAAVDTLTIEDSDISEFAYGVHDTGMQIDSLTIRRSLLHDAGYSAVYLNSYCSQCARPSQAVVIDSSRLERALTSYGLVSLATTLRRAVFTHSTFSNPGGTVLGLASSGAGYVSLAGDSIVSLPSDFNYQWIDAQSLDSLAIDAVVAIGFQRGDVSNVPLVRMSNSTLRDVSSYGLQVSPSGNGAVLRVDNVGIYGDPRDDLSATGLNVSNGVRTLADRLTGVNLYEGVYAEDSDSSVTVTHSLFQHVKYPIEWYSSSYPAPDSSGVTVRNTTFRGFYTAVEAYDGTVVADSNTFVNGNTAIDAVSPRPMTVTRNRISGADIGMHLDGVDSTAAVVVSDNVLTGVTATGIYAEGGLVYPDTLETVLDVRRNTVACSSAGATAAAGIDLRNAHFVALDNEVDGCFAGLVTSQQGSRLRSDSVVGNTLTVPANGQVGIGVTGIVSAVVRRNTVTGAAAGHQVYGLIDVASCPDYGNCPDEPIPTVVIDSNRVRGGTVWGVHAEDVDSLDIVANQVENLNNASIAYGYYSEEYGAIAVLRYLQTFARLLGNVVRHVHGNGIVVGHSGTSVSVDSNVVADIDSSGLTFQPNYDNGAATITRNLFTGARREGLLINEYYGTASVTDNNIAGNPGYGVRAIYAESRVDATNNWWGDPSGPTRCPEGCFSAGDSVDYYSVTWSPFRTAPNDAVPPLPIEGAPRFMAQARAVSPLRAVASANPLDARLTRGERLHGPKAHGAQTIAASRPAARLAPAAPVRFAAQRAAEERNRAERAVRAATRLQQLRDRAAARLRAEELIRARQASSRATRSQRVRP